MNKDQADTMFNVAPVSGAHFGLEVEVDLSSVLSTAEKEAFKLLYQQHGFILVRGQSLSMDQQLEACSILGPVLRDEVDNYLVSNVHEEGLLGNRELLFHNDIPYVPAPYPGASLHAVNVDKGVSPTRFVSGYSAYERLPSELRDRIEGMNALHVRQRAVGRRTRLTDLIPTDNCAVHAVVRRQAGTDRPYLFVNLDMTACIIGMSEAESDELLDELFSYLYREEQIYDHVWQQGDLIIWDNCAFQHARREISGGTRTLQRATLGELGYMDQYPVDLGVLSDLRSG